MNTAPRIKESPIKARQDMAAMIDAGARFTFKEPTECLASRISKQLVMDELLDGQIGSRLEPRLGFAWKAIVRPALERVFRYAQWYVSNIIDGQMYGGAALPWRSCPCGEGPPIEEQLSFTAPVASTTAQQAWTTCEVPSVFKFAKVPHDWKRPGIRLDVTALVRQLVVEYKPVIYEQPDDQKPVSIPELMQHTSLVFNQWLDPATCLKKRKSISRPLMERQQAGTDDHQIYQEYVKVLDDFKDPDPDPPVLWKVDDKFARGKIAVVRPTVYGRAIYDPDFDHLLQLEYVLLRGGSYKPTRQLYDFAYEHAGDGECVLVIVRQRRVDEEESMLSYEIVGTITGGHYMPIACPQTELARIPQWTEGSPAPVIFKGGRPSIFVAYGSHAIAPQPGKRKVKLGLVDWFPTAAAQNELRYQLVTSDMFGGLAGRAVFTHKAKAFAPFGYGGYAGKLGHIPAFEE